MSSGQCHELLGELSAYLDGEASEKLCNEIEQHLEECSDCRVVVDTLRKTVELVRDLPHPDFPDESRVRLYKSLGLSDQLAR